MKKIRVLLIEDEVEKRQSIAKELQDFFGENLRIYESDTLADASQKLFNYEYDLIIFDLILPRRNGDGEIDVSEEIVDSFMNSEVNRLTTAVAISRFNDAVDKHRSHFLRAGILLINYSEDEVWRACLRVCMQRVAIQRYYDFVVICALGEERSAFQGVNFKDFSVGELVNIAGMDGREFALGDLRGVCILQPQMGLVDASIIATKALETFSPRLICMSGICGGFEKNAEMGQVIVSDYAWEHQAGKWKGDQFEPRSYHERLDSGVRIALSQFIEEDPKLEKLASKTFEIQVPAVGAVLVPSVSGSAVIASDTFVERLKTQHGKVAAVDMEVFGLYRAAAVYHKSVICFAAKTVVDMAGEAKGDEMHVAGSLLSARFVISAIDRILK